MPEKLGQILCYRTGPKSQNPKECIIKFPDIKSVGEAAKLVGRKVVWPAENPKINGKILATHGKNGLLRGRFRRGVPGQALTTFVKVL